MNLRLLFSALCAQADLLKSEINGGTTFPGPKKDRKRSRNDEGFGKIMPENTGRAARAITDEFKENVDDTTERALEKSAMEAEEKIRGAFRPRDGGAPKMTADEKEEIKRAMEELKEAHDKTPRQSEYKSADELRKELQDQIEKLEVDKDVPRKALDGLADTLGKLEEDIEKIIGHRMGQPNMDDGTHHGHPNDHMDDGTHHDYHDDYIGDESELPPMNPLTEDPHFDAFGPPSAYFEHSGHDNDSYSEDYDEQDNDFLNDAPTGDDMHTAALYRKHHGRIYRAEPTAGAATGPPVDETTGAATPEAATGPPMDETTGAATAGDATGQPMDGTTGAATAGDATGQPMDETTGAATAGDATGQPMDGTTGAATAGDATGQPMDGTTGAATAGDATGQPMDGTAGAAKAGAAAGQPMDGTTGAATAGDATGPPMDWEEDYVHQRLQDFNDHTGKNWNDLTENEKELYEPFNMMDSSLGNRDNCVTRCEVKQFCQAMRDHHHHPHHHHHDHQITMMRKSHHHDDHDDQMPNLSNECCGAIWDEFMGIVSNEPEQSCFNFDMFLYGNIEGGFHIDHAIEHNPKCHAGGRNHEYLGEDVIDQMTNAGDEVHFEDEPVLPPEVHELTKCDALYSCTDRLPLEKCVEIVEKVNKDGDFALTGRELKKFINKMKNKIDKIEGRFHEALSYGYDGNGDGEYLTRDVFIQYCQDSTSEGRSHDKCEFFFEHCATVSQYEAMHTGSPDHFDHSDHDADKLMSEGDFLTCDFRGLGKDFKKHKSVMKALLPGGCMHGLFETSPDAYNNTPCDSLTDQDEVDFCNWDTAFGLGVYDNEISHCEAVYVCHEKGQSDVMCDYIFYFCDMDWDGKVNREEFRHCMQGTKEAIIAYHNDFDVEPCSYDTGCQYHCMGDSNCETNCQTSLETKGCNYVDEYEFPGMTPIDGDEFWKPSVEGCALKEKCENAWADNFDSDYSDYDGDYEENMHYNPDEIVHVHFPASDQDDHHHYSDEDFVWDHPWCQVEFDHRPVEEVFKNGNEGECFETDCDESCQAEIDSGYANTMDVNAVDTAAHQDDQHEMGDQNTHSDDMGDHTRTHTDPDDKGDHDMHTNPEAASTENDSPSTAGSEEGVDSSEPEDGNDGDNIEKTDDEDDEDDEDFVEATEGASDAPPEDATEATGDKTFLAHRHGHVPTVVPQTTQPAAQVIPPMQTPLTYPPMQMPTAMPPIYQPMPMPTAMPPIYQQTPTYYPPTYPMAGPENLAPTSLNQRAHGSHYQQQPEGTALLEKKHTKKHAKRHHHTKHHLKRSRRYGPHYHHKVRVHRHTPTPGMVKKYVTPLIFGQHSDILERAARQKMKDRVVKRFWSRMKALARNKKHHSRHSRHSRRVRKHGARMHIKRSRRARHPHHQHHHSRHHHHHQQPRRGRRQQKIIA